MANSKKETAPKIAETPVVNQETPVTDTPVQVQAETTPPPPPPVSEKIAGFKAEYTKIYTESLSIADPFSQERVDADNKLMALRTAIKSEEAAQAKAKRDAEDEANKSARRQLNINQLDAHEAVIRAIFDPNMSLEQKQALSDAFTTAKVLIPTCARIRKKPVLTKKSYAQ